LHCIYDIFSNEIEKATVNYNSEEEEEEEWEEYHSPNK